MKSKVTVWMILPYWTSSVTHLDFIFQMRFSDYCDGTGCPQMEERLLLNRFTLSTFQLARRCSDERTRKSFSFQALMWGKRERGQEVNEWTTSNWIVCIWILRQERWYSIFIFIKHACYFVLCPSWLAVGLNRVITLQIFGELPWNVYRAKGRQSSIKHHVIE